MLINLPFTTAAEDSDEDAENVTEDELGDVNGNSGGGFSSVPAAKQ